MCNTVKTHMFTHTPYIISHTVILLYTVHTKTYAHTHHIRRTCTQLLEPTLQIELQLELTPHSSSLFMEEFDLDVPKSGVDGDSAGHSVSTSRLERIR